MVGDDDKLMKHIGHFRLSQKYYFSSEPAKSFESMTTTCTNYAVEKARASGATAEEIAKQLEQTA